MPEEHFSLTDWNKNVFTWLHWLWQYHVIGCNLGIIFKMSKEVTGLYIIDTTGITKRKNYYWGTLNVMSAQLCVSVTYYSCGIGSILIVPQWFIKCFITLDGCKCFDHICIKGVFLLCIADDVLRELPEYWTARSSHNSNWGSFKINMFFIVKIQHLLHVCYAVYLYTFLKCVVVLCMYAHNERRWKTLLNGNV